MQNEFEKQVQQKMEELKLVPSAPVWQKVEMQIRQKRDRRRLILWIPLLALLLGGGLWFGIDQYSNDVRNNEKDIESTNVQLQKKSNVAPEQNVTNKPNEESRSKIELKEGVVSQTHSDKNITGKSQTNTLSTIENSYSEKRRIEKGNSIIKQRKAPFENKTDAVETKVSDEGIDEESMRVQQSNKQSGTVDTTLAFKNLDTAATTVNNDKVIEESKTVPQKNDSNVIRQTAKKQSFSKWKYALAFSAGRSGSGRLNLFNGFFGGQKSMDYAASPSGGQVYYPPSEVKKRGSFGIAVLAKKQLTKRSSFSTGLQYNYYSSSMLVGNRVSRDTMLGQYNVSQYYLNYPTNNAAITFESYHNRYHFVSLPLAIDWQLLRKVPLNLSTGLSFQYLVKTNGLMFDFSRQAYFHNKDAFSRFQLFSDLGLTYSIRVKNTSIAVGPGLQYGLSRLEKGNSNHHLFMYGLKAQWSFNKK